MQMFDSVIVLALIALGYGAQRWFERTLDARTQFLVTIAGSVLMVILFVSFTTYSWMWIMMGLILGYSIYRRYKAFRTTSG